MKKSIGCFGWLVIIGLLGVFINAFNTSSTPKTRPRPSASTPNRSFTTSSGTPVSVTLTSDPNRARVTVSQRYVGQTPVTIQVDAGTEYKYVITPEEPYDDYDLYVPFSGTLKATESTAISIWIDRTTAEQQAQQRAEAEAARAEAERQRERLLESQRVYYRLETNCSRGADLTYTNINGDTTQQANRGNDWYYGFVPRSGQHLYISAQNQCSSGFVRVKLVQDGNVIRENTSNGGYTIATISGRW